MEGLDILTHFVIKRVFHVNDSLAPMVLLLLSLMVFFLTYKPTRGYAGSVVHTI